MITVARNDQPAWQALKEAGLVSGRQPETVKIESPWYVRAMLGVAGWIAAFFLLGFVTAGLAWVLKSEFAAMIAGLIMIGGAWLMLKRLGRNDFAAQFALAFSFAGQALFIYGLLDWFGPADPGIATWAIIALVQAALAMLMPNSIHRLWSSFAAAGAFYIALYTAEIGFVSSALILALAAWVWLDEFRWPRHGTRLRPIAYGLVVALIIMDMSTGMFGVMIGVGPDTTPALTGGPWLAQLLIGAVLLWVVWRMLRLGDRPAPGRVAIAALSGTVALILISLEAPGICLGITILLLGFAHGNRILTGLGITALLLYIGGYYYSLQVTLLAKSQTLALTGAVVLALRWLVLGWLKPATESGDA